MSLRPGSRVVNHPSWVNSMDLESSIMLIPSCTVINIHPCREIRWWTYLGDDTLAEAVLALFVSIEGTSSTAHVALVLKPVSPFSTSSTSIVANPY
jgi:hypothetical protein